MNFAHLQELQRFAEVGRMSAGLIHDMSGPLTAAILHLEQDELHSLSSVRNARRNIRILERYIEAARRQLRHQEDAGFFHIKKEVTNAKHILLPLGRQKGIGLQFKIYTGCVLRGDPLKFQRIITNLVINSLEAYDDSAKSSKPRIKITVGVCRGSLIIRVRDGGSGISPEQMPKLFEPFYTTKTPGGLGGTGIGLYNTKHYVENDFGGNITAVSSLSQGTEFKVSLPLKIHATKR
jgi:two-component system C4-dicarboxylate transport sensor histidine kinase DctB